MPVHDPDLGAHDDLPCLRLVRDQTRLARIGARLVALVFVAFALALALAPWQQSVRGHGRVIAFTPDERQQAIEAPVAGRLARWFVAEGERVGEGDPIVEITDNDPALMSRLEEQRRAAMDRLQAAQNRLFAYESRVDALRASRIASVESAESRIEMIRARLRAAEQSLAADEASAEAARLNLERQEALLVDGLTSVRSVELARLEGARTRSAVETSRAAVSGARSEQRAAAADRRRIETDADAALAESEAKREDAQAEVANEKIAVTRIEMQLARQATQRVVAPREGTILRLMARQGGEVVAAGDPLALLVPHTESRAVELLVDGNDAPLIAAGRHVRVQFEGWPAVQFAGWPSVAVGTFGGEVAFVDAADDGAGRFRVVVVPAGEEPWPAPHFLRQGVRTNGWILLDEVRLGYELWRLFNGFPPVVDPAAVSGDAAKVGGSKATKAAKSKEEDA
ncbi:MAG: HlyD family efflux transporter periplasmic adaptor subunit [Nannocystaceae bacterium]